MSEPDKQATPSISETHAWAGAGAMATPRDLTGVTLGDFQVERLLGQGGMGEVYLARQTSLNRPVALKVLRPDLLTKPTYISRFEAEATAVAKLNHPNIVHVYTLGTVDNTRFIAMEYVQGTNLRDYLRKKGALDLPLALSMMKQAGVAIGAAGELGLIHRDIKPENLLMTRKGQVKVADFGLCRDLDAQNIQLTQSGITMGTPQYMSPEQAQGQAVDHRSDLYSLGVTFYHMLAGTPPFRAETALAVALKHVKDTPVSLTVHRADIPVELDRLVLKLMAKDPSDRYQSAAEMLRDLSKVREALNAPSMVMPVAEPAAATNGAPAAVTTPASTKSAAASKSKNTLFTLSSLSESKSDEAAGFRLGQGALTALILVGLAAGLAWGWYARPPDLISAAAEQPAGMPGLWISPEWERTERKPTATMQYRYAQLGVPASEQLAAWLAVPGFFPSARDACALAYTQLARTLLREHDLDRLKVLAAEIARWNPETNREKPIHEQELTVIIQAAADALDGKLQDVVAELDPEKIHLKTMSDPALLELAVEVTVEAERIALRDNMTGDISFNGLRSIRNRLLQSLSNQDSQVPSSRGRLG
jgi:serine/threonine protein kinase